MSKSFVRRALTFLVLCGVLVLVPAPAETQRDTSSADARLRALYTEEWNWRREEMGRRSDEPGEAGASNRFPRVDAASQQARLAYWTRTLATLDSIPLADLSPEEKVNAQVFRASIHALSNEIKFRTYEAPFNSDTFFWTDFTPRQGFVTVSAYRAYLGRLRDVPRYFDEQVTNMRAGLARGFTVPRVSVVGRDKTIEPYVKGDTANPLYAPFTQMPSSISATDQTALRAEAETVLREVVAPAYERLLTFMRTEYLPKARTTLAAAAMPDGEAYYQAMIEKFTTLNLTAKQIHEMGLKEVARIEKEMEATKQRAKFTGTMAEFFQFLRTDPQFYAKTPRELLSVLGVRLEEGRLEARRDDRVPAAAQTRHPACSRRAGAHLYRWARRARSVHDEYLQPAGAPALHARGADAARVHAGPQFSGSARTRRARAPSVSSQHLILSLRRRMGTLHRVAGHRDGDLRNALRGLRPAHIRNVARVPAGDRHGNPQFGWSRERAMDYLRTRAALSDHEITTEVERYIAWPAQALAYKLGELQIRRHRREAEEKLGSKFDQRHFHDAILALGSVPLPVLEQRMAQFVADGGVNPPTAPQR